MNRYLLVLFSAALLLVACSNETEPATLVQKGFSFSIDPTAQTISLNQPNATLSTLALECGDSEPRILLPDEELALMTFNAVFLPGNRLEITGGFKNVTDFVFEQPFTFTQADTTSNILSSDEPTIGAAALGGDDKLSSNESTSLLTFQVEHKGEPFTYEVIAKAVVDCNDGPAPMPDLTVLKTNDTESVATIGIPFKWLFTIRNEGDAAASFAPGDTIFTDQLPAEASYAPVPVDVDMSGVSGLFDCLVEDGELNCLAVGPSGATFAPGAVVTFAIIVTPSAVGELVNPVAGVGVCVIDADSVITESNESNNSCTDTVTVTEMQTSGSIEVFKSADPSDGTDFPFTLTRPNNSDVNVILDDDDGADPVRTDNFKVSSLDAGDYDITEELPANWTLDSVDCGDATVTEITNGVTVSLTQGEDVVCTFNNSFDLPTYDLRIIKYNDLDQDGTDNELNKGAGDPPSGNALVGWEFTVYDDQGNQVAQGTTSVENPGANGDLGIRVTLPNLVSGETYAICETQQEGWVNSQPGTIDSTYGEPCETVTLTSSTIVTRYFGNYEEPDPIQLYATKFRDDKVGGVDSTNDERLAGWQFTLYDAMGNQVSQATTGEDGQADLGSHPAGIYTWCETPQDGWENTVGSNTDFDPEGLNRPCATTEVPDTVTNLSRNFWNYEIEN